MAQVAGPSSEAVRTWLADIDGRILEIQGRVEPLLAEQARLREQRKLLGELLTSFGEEPIPGVPGGDTQVVLHSPPSVASPRRETVRERVHREVVSVLDEIGRPLHINDLLVEYVKRGFSVPGQGKSANLSVHLSGWNDIENPERGIYRLVDGTPGEGAQ